MQRCVALFGGKRVPIVAPVLSLLHYIFKNLQKKIKECVDLSEVFARGCRKCGTSANLSERSSSNSDLMMAFLKIKWNKSSKVIPLRSQI